MPDDDKSVYAPSQVLQDLWLRHVPAARQTPDEFVDPMSGASKAQLQAGGEAAIGVGRHFAELPQKAFEASENLRQGGSYDPSAVVEASGLLGVGGIGAAERGAVGAFGGKLAEELLPGSEKMIYETANPRFPRTANEINSNAKVELGTVHRGTEANPVEVLRNSSGDLGKGVYVTPERRLAESYGGGPAASVGAGTRQVHSFAAKSLYPEDVAYVFGGSRYNEPVQLISGNGILLWEGPYSGQNLETQLAGTGIKVVIGTPDSVGVNQIAVRDPSILYGLAGLGVGLGAEGAGKPDK
jgi:hypothetical protein